MTRTQGVDPCVDLRPMTESGVSSRHHKKQENYLSEIAYWASARAPEVISFVGARSNIEVNSFKVLLLTLQ